MTTDAPIEPDTKDWTWVLERQCPDCLFDASNVDVARTGEMIHSIVRDWQGHLAGPNPGTRRQPNVWSTLEYGCHVRDVFIRFDQRLLLMLTEQDPQFANWDQDLTAVTDNYGAQDPLVVSGQLAAAGARLAQRFDGVHADQWQRRGRRSDGAVFTVATLAQYLLHDPTHHLWDVS